MSDRRNLDLTLPWLAEGTRRFIALTDRLTDEELAAASLLEGWTRAHVVAHVALNAEALGRLVHWAATGEETPMYRDSAQRVADIENLHPRPATELRHRLKAESERLTASLAALSRDGWNSEVRTRQGRPIPALEIPWMRVREVWMHAVDLGRGMHCSAFPPRLATVLLGEVTQWLGAMDGCPSLALVATDSSDAFAMGVAGEEASRVRGSTAELLAWATGRSLGESLIAETNTCHAVALPQLPPWL